MVGRNLREPDFSPLILLPAQLEREKTPNGPRFHLSGLGDAAETNAVLAEMLRREKGLDLPPFESGSAEEYFERMIGMRSQLYSKESIERARSSTCLSCWLLGAGLMILI